MTLRHDEASAGAATDRDSREKLPPQVLVVDDAAAVRGCVAFALRASGYRVREAADGLAARFVLMDEQPALVISDLEMPVCDGWEVLRYCHAQHPEMPVLVISGAGLGRRPEIERWAAGFLPKPFSIARVRTEVQRLLSRAA